MEKLENVRDDVAFRSTVLSYMGSGTFRFKVLPGDGLLSGSWCLRPQAPSKGTTDTIRYSRLLDLCCLPWTPHLQRSTAPIVLLAPAPSPQSWKSNGDSGPSIMPMSIPIWMDVASSTGSTSSATPLGGGAPGAASSGRTAAIAHARPVGPDHPILRTLWARGGQHDRRRFPLKLIPV
jgi:hypothetical protein